MKRSKLVLILVLVITVALGGVAVWIGWRLSQKKEVTPEEGEAAGRNSFVCTIKHDLDGRGYMNCNECSGDFYAWGGKDTDPTDPGFRPNAICTLLQVDNPGQPYRWWVYNYDGGLIYEGEKTEEAEKQIKAEFKPERCAKCGVYGTFSATNQTEADPAEPIDATWVRQGNGTYTVTINRLRAINYWPQFSFGGVCKDTIEQFKASISLSGSGLNFKVSIYDNGTLMPNQTYTYNYGTSQNVVCQPDSGVSVEWHPKASGGTSHYPRDKRVICTLSGVTIPNLNLRGGHEYRLEAKIIINTPSGKSWGINPATEEMWQTSDACKSSFSISGGLTCDSLTASPTTLTTAGGEVTLTARATAQNVTISNYNYGSDLNESSLEDGGTTSTWTIPAGTASGEYHAWVSVNGGSLTNIGCTGRDTCSQGGERCQVTVTVQSQAENLICQDLASSVDLSSITEDDIRTGNLSTSLTTTISTTNVTINPTNGYSYYTNVPHARFGSDTSDSTIPYANGSSPSLIIPQNTPNGSYYISVMVNGTGASGAVQSGCDSGTHCTGGGDSCLINFSIGEGTCNCEGVTRSPSGNEITAGSLVSYIMTAGDQNGNDCLVDASNVNWTTTGTPSLVTQNREPEPISGITDEAVQHHIIYEIPSAASSGSEYCVSSGIAGLSQVEACRNCFTIGGQPVPAFAAVKTSEMVCINNNTAARITYTIQVRNISEVAGVIEYVEDTYDSRFESSWVSNITPTPDSHLGNVIRWDNSDQGYTLEANDGAPGGNDEMEFSYIVTVPSAYFGTYEDGEFVPNQFRNHAIVKPENQDAIELSTIVQVICLARTGLFNNAVTLSIVGLLFLIIGIVLFRLHEYTYIYLSPGEKFIIRVYKNVRKGIRNGISEIKEGINDRLHLTKKERFEKKSIKKVEKKLGKI